MCTDSLEVPGLPESFAVQPGPLKWPTGARATISSDSAALPLEDCLPSQLGAFLISERLKVALQEKRIQGVEFYAVDIFMPDGNRLANFWHLHFLHHLAALDKAHSEGVHETPEKILAVWRVAVKRERISAELDAFRLKEWKRAQIVSGRFVEAYRGAHCKGLSFDRLLVT